MALTTSVITGDVPLPDGEAALAAELEFVLTGFDTEGDDTVLPGPKFIALDGVSIPAGTELWRNTEGLRATKYRVIARWSYVSRAETVRKAQDLGLIQVGTDASYTLAQLLNSTPPAPPTVFWSTITEEQYIAALAARDEAVAAAAAINGRATVGGTPNAITLASPSTLVTGRKLRFRAASQNTGAATIALNGGAAVACRTITGAALPSGYIRTDVDTEAVYDGTNWVLGREIERGSNANGEFAKFADGTMICTHRLTAAALAIATAYFGGFRSAAANVWTYPAAFTALPRVTAAIVNGTAFGAILGTISATTADWYPTAVTSQAGTDRTVDLLAVGRWF